jgi:excisionase family DNA binding protein
MPADNEISSDEALWSDIRFLTVAEAATILRVSRMTIYRLVHSGELDAIRVGRTFRIPEIAINQYLRDAYIEPDFRPRTSTKPARSSPKTSPTAIRIYLTIGDNPGPIEEAVLALLDAYGFEIEHRHAPVVGSWFREFLVRAKASTPPLEEQLVKVARAVELQGLDHPQSEVDLNQAEAVAKLLSSLDADSDALIQIGSVFLVKFERKIIVRNLTQIELAYFNRNPALFQDPEKALQVLQRGWPGPQPPSIASDS